MRFYLCQVNINSCTLSASQNCCHFCREIAVSYWIFKNRLLHRSLSQQSPMSTCTGHDHILELERKRKLFDSDFIWPNGHYTIYGGVIFYIDYKLNTLFNPHLYALFMREAFRLNIDWMYNCHLQKKAYRLIFITEDDINKRNLI